MTTRCSACARLFDDTEVVPPTVMPHIERPPVGRLLPYTQRKSSRSGEIDVICHRCWESEGVKPENLMVLQHS